MWNAKPGVGEFQSKSIQKTFLFERVSRMSVEGGTNVLQNAVSEGYLAKNRLSRQTRNLSLLNYMFNSIPCKLRI